MIVFHTVVGCVAIISGLAVILLGKGTCRHQVIGYVYAASMYVLCLASFAIRDTTPFFKGLGMFHVMALISLVTVTAGMVPALHRKRVRNWFDWHYASML